MLDRRRIALALVLVCLLPSVATAGAIYKWVDNAGVTHYGESPPPGIKAQPVGSPSTPAVGAPQTEGARQTEQINRGLAERAAARAAQQEQEQVARDAAADRLARCSRARQQLQVVERGGPVYRYDERGERVYLEDAARDAEIARLRGEADAVCSGVDADEAAQRASSRWRGSEADRSQLCLSAQERLRELQAPEMRAPNWEIEQARAAVNRNCATD